MYTHLPQRGISARLVSACAALLLCGAVVNSASPTVAQTNQGIVHNVATSTDRIDLTENTSRILTLQNRFTRVQVNNPNILTPTPLSPNQVQISAKTPGVTQMNLWDENGQVYSIDVIVSADVQDLQMAIDREFPHASVKVVRYNSTLLLSGFVDSPQDVSVIQEMAQDYAPKVINNIRVGGVQQVLLNVQVMEVSRTKLRQLGFDWAELNGDDFVIQSVSGLIDAAAAVAGSAVGTGGSTVDFGIITDNNKFFGALEALRRYDLLKILAEPQLVTTSGRPASFQSGGEFPILVPQSLGTTSIEYKKYGTQVEFLPLVLGNGNIRLEVRPRVSEIDNTRSVTINETTVPGLKVRQVDTAVEMKAGQTLALAGLVQTRIESQNKGLPILADMPLVGMAFRRVEENLNEVELLILVRPEFVDGMDPQDVPPGGPGTDTCSPSDKDLYCRGMLEVECDNCNNNGCLNCRRYSSFSSDPSGPVPGGSAEVIAPGTTSSNSWMNPYVVNEGKTVIVSDGPVTSSPPPQATPKHAVQPQSAVGPRMEQPQPSSDGASSSDVYRSSRRQVSSPGLVGPVGYDVDK